MYVLYDDCPSEFGQAHIVMIFRTLESAIAALCGVQLHTPYETQYYTIHAWEVE